MGAPALRRHDGAMPDNLAVRLRTWWRRDELDEQLAHGVDPEADAGLSRRAARLRSRPMRNELASSLESAVREAHRPWSVSARLPLARVAVRGCAEDILSVARRLRANEPIDVRGAAMVARVVCNGDSPLYGDAAVSLRYAMRSARLALDPVAAGPREPSEVG
jgi:hypothetical protein